MEDEPIVAKFFADEIIWKSLPDWFQSVQEFVVDYYTEYPPQDDERQLHLLVPIKGAFAKMCFLQARVTNSGLANLKDLPNLWVFDRAEFYYEGKQTVERFALIFRRKTILEQLVRG